MARTPIHPGEILANDLIEMPPKQAISEFWAKRNVTTDNAYASARHFEIFWENHRFLDEPAKCL